MRKPVMTIVKTLLDEDGPEDPKQAIERNPEFAAGLQSLADYEDYVEGYVVEYFGPVSREQLKVIMDILRRDDPQHWAGVYEVFQAMEEAGLGRVDDFEREFHDAG